MSEPTPASQGRSWVGIGCIVALVVYWIILAIATHMPLPAPAFPGANIDKLEHLGGYFVLGSLLGACVALRYGASRRNLLIAWGVVLVYAALEEVTQIPFNRHCDLYDWIADAIGSGVALTIVWLIARPGRPSLAPPTE